MVASPGQPCGVGAPCFFSALAMAVLKLFSRRFDSLISALCSLTAANTGSIALVVIVISGSSYGPSVIADARAAFERLVKRSIEAAREASIMCSQDEVTCGGDDDRTVIVAIVR